MGSSSPTPIPFFFFFFFFFFFSSPFFFFFFCNFFFFFFSLYVFFFFFCFFFFVFFFFLKNLQNRKFSNLKICYCGVVVLRPRYTSKVTSGRSVNLTHFSWAGLDLLSG